MRRLHGLARRIADRFGCADDVQDLRQEALLAILEAIDKRGELDAPLAFVIAGNRMTKRAVQWTRRPTDGLPADEALQPNDRPCDLEAVLDVREAVSELGPIHREAILSTLDGPLGKTHEALGLTFRALESRLARARKRLRDRLGDGYDHMRRRHPKHHGDHGLIARNRRKAARQQRQCIGT